MVSLSQERIVIPVVAVSLALAIGLAPGTDSSAGTSANIDAEAVNVKAYVNGEPVAETHNVLMEGEEAIEEQIKSGEAINYDTIALGNGTAPADGDGTLNEEIAECGLSPATGSFADDGDGTWNLSATFDVTCDDIDVNTTAQKSSGAGSDYDYFAGADLGRTINLYSGDSLTIEWENQVE